MQISISEFYLLVPAAEEEDLLEELAHEYRHVEGSASGNGLKAVDEWCDDPGPTAPDAELMRLLHDLGRAGATQQPVALTPDPDVLRPGQVLGLLQHRLGGRVL